MIRILILIGLLLIPTSVWSQPNTPCSHETYNFVVSNSTGSILYMCGPSNTWVDITPSSGGLPANLIILTLTTRPSGYTEATELNGLTVVGILAANKDVGTTGGVDNITPVGTNSSLTFTGTPFSSIINHTHPVTDPGHTHLTQRYPTATGSSSGFTIDTSMSGTLADNTLPTKTNTTGVTTNNPAGGVASITPAGTINTPVFTGDSLDNRSAFIRVIFCKKS